MMVNLYNVYSLAGWYGYKADGIEPLPPQPFWRLHKTYVRMLDLVVRLHVTGALPLQVFLLFVPILNFVSIRLSLTWPYQPFLNSNQLFSWVDSTQ